MGALFDKILRTLHMNRPYEDHWNAIISHQSSDTMTRCSALGLCVGNRTGLTSWTLTRRCDQHTTDKVAHYSIYRPERMKDWVGWLIADGLPLTYMSGHPSGRAWDRGSSPVKENKLTNQTRYLTSTSIGVGVGPFQLPAPVWNSPRFHPRPDRQYRLFQTFA